MAATHKHAEITFNKVMDKIKNKYGNEEGPYNKYLSAIKWIILDIHILIDSCKDSGTDNRVRLFTHHIDFVEHTHKDIKNYYKNIFPELIDMMENDDIYVRDIMEDHIYQDFNGKCMPTIGDYTKGKILFPKHKNLLMRHIREYWDKEYVEKILEIIYPDNKEYRNFTFNTWFVYNVLPRMIEDHRGKTNAYDVYRVLSTMVYGKPYTGVEIVNSIEIQQWMLYGIGYEKQSETRIPEHTIQI